jgi:hypothetical protein
MREKRSFVGGAAASQTDSVRTRRVVPISVNLVRLAALVLLTVRSVAPITHIGSAPDGGRSRPLQRHLGIDCQSKGQSFEQCVTHLILALDRPHPFSSNPALFDLDHAVPSNCYQMP